MPRLTITAADHVDCPGPEGGDPEAQLWHSRDASGCVYGCTVGGLCWMCWPGRVSFRFRPLADEVLAVAQSSLQTDFIHDTYRRQALPMILQVRGHEVLHASAVAMPQGVVALCGESGVGKSTLAYGLHRRGYRLCADDAIGFQTSGQSIRAVPLPFSIRLRPEAATFFDYDRAAASLPPDHSNVLIPSDEAELPAFVALGILTRAEDLPAGRSVEVRRLTSAQTLEAVLPHAYCFSLHDEERKRRMLEQYLQMCARLPVFSIRFQPGLENLPAVLDAIEPLGKTG